MAEVVGYNETQIKKQSQIIFARMLNACIKDAAPTLLSKIKDGFIRVIQHLATATYFIKVFDRHNLAKFHHGTIKRQKCVFEAMIWMSLHFCG